MWRDLAKAVSALLHPYLTPLYVVLVILGSDSTFSLFPPRLKLYMLWVSALYCTILPFITCGVLWFVGRNRRYGFLRRSARLIRLLVSVFCFLLGSTNFMQADSLGLFFEITSTGLCCTLFILLTSKWWRASTHLTAAGGALSLLVMMNVVGRSSHLTALLAAILLIGVLTSARLYLGRSSLKQAALSLAGGIIASVLSLILL